MTTIRERSTAALAKALGEVSVSDSDNWAEDVIGDHTFARVILAASPTLAADLDLAIAWREAVAALPEGWRGPSIHRPSIPGVVLWRAMAVEASVLRPMPVSGDGPTPTEALVALAEALRARAAA